jgi:hypothetical protein
MTEAQEKILNYHKAQYERNLKTWAIDRALETLKIMPSHEVSAKEIVDAADVLCAYVVETPKEWPIPTEAEAEAELVDLQNKGVQL